MRRTLVALAVLLAVCGPEPAAQTTPKLVVMLVVDQMRADYLTRFDHHWNAGFRTLLRDGMVFDNANYPYLLTVTCAGHATIGTGSLPRTHGMISNGWWHRDERRTPECTADPDVKAVTYGAPVTTGSSPKRLLVPTLADELRGQKPGARVVSLSLKSRGAITLAGRAADAIVWFDDPAGTFATSTAYSQVPVPEVKRFIDANPHARDFGRTWTLVGPPESYVYRDAGIGERPPAPWTALFPHAIVAPAARAGGPAPAAPAAAAAGAARGRAAGSAPAAPVDGAPTVGSNGTAPANAAATQGSTGAAAPAPAAAAGQPLAAATNVNLSGLWQSTPYADSYLARMAISLMDSFKLGRRDTTDFLSVSFSTLDDVGHAFGPESREVEDVLRHLDRTLGEVIQALDAQVGRGNYVLAFSADHGVAPFAGLGRGGRIHNEDVRDRIDETLAVELGPLAQGSYVDAISSGYIYLAPGIADRLKAKPGAMDAVERGIEEMPGVAQLLRADQISEASRDRAVRAAALSYVPDRAGDLLIVVKEYWSLLGRATNIANHGTMYGYDTQVPMIFFGGGIKPGHSGAGVTPADIAPTLAGFAGVTMTKADGRALREVRR